MRSHRPPWRSRVLALAVHLVAPVMTSPATAAQAPATTVEPPTAATLLEQARAHQKAGDHWHEHESLVKLLADFDGTPEATAGALRLAELLIRTWRVSNSGLREGLRRIEHSKSYQRPEAAELRRVVASRTCWCRSGR